MDWDRSQHTSNTAKLFQLGAFSHVNQQMMSVPDPIEDLPIAGMLPVLHSTEATVR
jgi:hypothetical protein